MCIRDRGIPVLKSFSNNKSLDNELSLIHIFKDLEQQVSRYEKETDRARKFISLISRYENFDELTTTMINEFVEKIIVHERDRKGSQTSKQKIEIYFNFIGNYELPQAELSDEEKQKLEEEERKIKKRKDKLCLLYTSNNRCRRKYR